MKIILSLLLALMLIGLASAVPQIFTTTQNLTIFSNQSGNVTTGYYELVGEGGVLKNTFSVNTLNGSCSFSYNVNNIPLIFSREIKENDTDLATLIRWINDNKNISEEWKACQTNLSWCMTDTGYKANYTQKANELDICYRARDSFSDQVKDLNEKISGLTSWRNIGFVVGIIGIAFSIWTFRKNQVKKAENPYNKIPTAAVQY